MITIHPDIDHLLVGRSFAAAFITQIHAPQDRMPLPGRRTCHILLTYIEIRRISSILKSPQQHTEPPRPQAPAANRRVILLVDCIRNKLQTPFYS